MRARRRAIATETMEILDRGWYPSADGRRVELAGDTARAVLHRPDELDAELDGVRPGEHATRVEVTNETTFAAAARLRGDTVCLNFASATHPGGGFQNGAQAQEESLARASTLYPSLLAASEFYTFHRARHDLLYSDHMIYSPHVQVFRDDHGDLLAEPYSTAVITAAAPNTRRIEQGRRREVAAALRVRSAKVLAVARMHGHRTLVLGAWGCGVFGNDSHVVAAAFRDHLAGPFSGAFEQVVFAVLDHADGLPTYTAFRTAFAGH